MDSVERNKARLYYICGKLNHLKKDFRRYIEWKRKHPDQQAKVASEDNEDEYCFTVDSDDSEKLYQYWYIDSGTSAHMCGDKRQFINLHEEYRSHVRLVNDYKLTVNGKGEVLLQSD